MNFQTRIQTLMVIISSLFVIIFSLELFGYPMLTSEIDCSINNTRQEGIFCLVKGIFVTIFGAYGNNVFYFTLITVFLYLAWYFYKNKSVIKQNIGSRQGNIIAKVLVVLLISIITISLTLNII